MHPPMKATRDLQKKFFQQGHFLYYAPAFLFFLLSALGIAFTFQTSPKLTAQASSSELGVAATSPRGTLGGLVVPASCASRIHNSADEYSACSNCNLCGACNTGQSQCGGACNVGAPALPSGYDSVCTKTNVCGGVSFGRIQCDGSCNAVAPALPSGYGTSCGGCGGSIMCNGSCSIPSTTIRRSTPADPDGGKVVPGNGRYIAPAAFGAYCFQNNSSNTYFVPVGTKDEFTKFWSNPPAGIVKLIGPDVTCAKC